MLGYKHNTAAHRHRQPHPARAAAAFALLSVGGPLIDAGFEVELLDAEFGPMTYRWEDILRDHPEIDYIVRGAGERTATALMKAWHAGADLAQVEGIALRAVAVQLLRPARKT